MRSCLTIALLLAAGPAGAAAPLTLASSSGTAGAAQARTPTPLAPSAQWALLRQHIRYVFVLFQENRSFDHYFGTYPGANGLLTSFPGADLHDPMQQAARDGASFRQVFWRMDGSFGTITPFLIPRTLTAPDGRIVQLYPEDIASVTHSHLGMASDMHFDRATQSHSRNDAYAITNESLAYKDDASDPSGLMQRDGGPITSKPKRAAVQMGEVVMAHVDCDTIPFLWRLADRFTLFDNFHQTTIGPSTPNAIAMIAGQTGETQWALHPAATGRHLDAGVAIPNIVDTAPFAGSTGDTTPGAKPPYGPDKQEFGPASSAPPPSAPIAGATLAHLALKGTPGPYNVSLKNQAQPPLTFASLPLSFMGRAITDIVRQDENPALDLADVAGDIAKIAGSQAQIPWGWYQQGYTHEPFDGAATINLEPAATAHPSYIVHHNGPQYFGYVGDNPAELAHMHGLQDFYTDVAAHRLPPAGGVFYVRGGYYNNDNLQTLNPNPDIRATYAGNDDHPGYSDSQISEASIADSVNAIAASPYWPQSAIIIAYDETDGFYDHVPERVRSWGPDRLPLTGGPRIPAILISPYAAAHTISHVYSEHSSVIKFIDTLFALTPLADLPDERHGRALGAANPTHDPDLPAPDGHPQHDLGPADDLVDMGDLSEAFDPDRLLGHAALLPPSYAHIDDVRALPHAGCAALHITPTDYVDGKITDPPPADFSPRPGVSPGAWGDPGWRP